MAGSIRHPLHFLVFYCLLKSTWVTPGAFFIFQVISNTVMVRIYNSNQVKLIELLVLLYSISTAQ